MLQTPKRSSAPSGSDPAAAVGLPHKNGLYYTRWGLMAVFAYLLLGDFCLQFMEAVMPSIMPLQLDAAGASNTVKAVVMGTLAAFFNMVLNPYISFKSDGMRTAWGRRRPILLCMTPFVCLALVMIAYAPEVSRWLQGLGLGAVLAGGVLPKAPAMATLVVALAGAVIVFQLFNNLMAPVFYYLFVDVVPDACMGRFIALFRIVGALAGYAFNMWIFPHAMTHTRVIYVGAALFYGIGFLIMTIMVKEGSYPAPIHEKSAPVMDKVRVYVKECYGHKHYLWFNLRNAFFVLSFSSDMFIVFYLTKSLHISLEDIGHIGANATLVLLVLIYPSGALADRFKPLRVSFATMLLGLPVGLVCFLFITSRPSFLLLGFAGAVLKGMVANLDLPLYASIPPQERYGQFGSANQLFICLFSIPGSFFTGVLMDWLTQNGTRPEMYRYCYLWGFVMFGIATGFMYLLYRSWREHGGPHHYLPPRV